MEKDALSAHQLVERYGKISDAFNSRGIDTIRNCRPDARNADFANAVEPIGLCGSGMSVQMTSTSGTSR
jgi:hypothetical protein